MLHKARTKLPVHSLPSYPRSSRPFQEAAVQDVCRFALSRSTYDLPVDVDIKGAHQAVLQPGQLTLTLSKKAGLQGTLVAHCTSTTCVSGASDWAVQVARAHVATFLCPWRARVRWHRLCWPRSVCVAQAVWRSKPSCVLWRWLTIV